MARHVLAAALLLLAGCFHFHFVNGDAKPAPEATDESWHHGLAWGIAELSPPVPVSDMCKGDFARVDSEESFLNGFVQVVTFGIYAPQTVTLTCPATPGGQAPQSPTRPWK